MIVVLDRDDDSSSGGSSDGCTGYQHVCECRMNDVSHVM